MEEQRKNISLGFTGEHFPESSHICLIYDNESQRQKIVSEYLSAGINHGELVRYFTDATQPDEIRSWLKDIGVKIPEAEKNGSFTIANADRAYCPSGHFDPHAMIDGSVQRYDKAREAGYSGMRSCGEMSWVFKGIPGSDRLLEYEALLNTVTSPFPHSGMCQYDARLFDGATLLKVLQVHPLMIAQGQIVRNPFYVKPEDFLSNTNSQKM